MDFSRHIDFLSVTFPQTVPREQFDTDLGTFNLVGQGAHGYELRFQNDAGVTLMTQGSDVQGHSVTWTGKPLERYREGNNGDWYVLGVVERLQGRASRADLTLNVYDGGVTPSEIWEQLTQGQVITKAKSDRRITDSRLTNDGFYVGSEKSDRYMRVYHKGYEQKRFTDDWVRFELITRKLVARAYVDGIIKSRREGEFINRAIDEYCSFPMCEPYRNAVADDGIDIPHFTRKEPNFWRWMERQVIPAIAERSVIYPQESVIERLLQAIELKAGSVRRQSKKTSTTKQGDFQNGRN